MDSSIIVALIMAAPPTIVGLLAHFTSKKAKITASEAKTAATEAHHTGIEAVALLTGNGKGTVPVMLEKLLDGQARHEVDDEVRFRKIDVRLGNLEGDAPSQPTS